MRSTPEELDAAEREADEIFRSVFALGVEGKLSGDAIASFDLAMGELRSRIAARRAALRRADFRPDRARRLSWGRRRERRHDRHFPTRRTVLATSAFAAGFFTLDPALAQAPLDPTPECHDGDAATLRQTEGPFFKPSSPERADLIEPGMAGQPIELAGFVLTRGCKPVPGALLDLWHADAKGDYDNSGFRLRGHQFADADGRFRFRTIVPGSLSGPHAPLPRQGAAERRPGADHAALFPGRAGQPHGRPVPPRTVDTHRQEPGIARRALRFRPGLR